MGRAVSDGANGAGRRARGLLAALIPALLVACGGGSGGSSNTSASIDGCSIPEQNQFLYDAMRDIYLWNDEMPVVDPADFDSPEELLNALRVPQDRFSFLTTVAQDDAFFGAGQFAGIGIRSRQPGEDELRVVDVFEGGPADQAGMARGDTILAVNGRPIEEILAEEGFSASLGDPDVGVPVDILWENPAGERIEATLIKAVVTIPPVATVDVLVTNAGPVGYLAFRTFVEPAASPLQDAFATFRAAGASSVIIDVRYNSGGLLSIAELLADLAGGEGAVGQPIYTLEYNDDNTARNQTVLFRDRSNSLNPERLVFITTGSSASASEMVINALEPFYDVALVGATTLGKPVGQVAISFCERVLRPVSFRTVNALGEGDFFDGLPVDCPAEDDLDYPFGDPAEASMAEALHYVENAACTPAAAVAASPRSKPSRFMPDWRLLDAD